MTTISYRKLSDHVLEWLDKQDGDTFKCPSEAEMIAWFNKLSGREKTLLLSFQQLPSEGWELESYLVEMPKEKEIVH